VLNRVHAFDVDIESGKVVHAGIAAIVIAPDNIRVDIHGMLFIASPGSNQVIAVDLKNHSNHVVFDASTKETRKIADEWFRRSQLGLPRRALITSKMYDQMPGLLTGMFFSQDGHTMYVANLGKDIVRMNFR
jgi:sugar lactone lactonase YvrE